MRFARGVFTRMRWERRRMVAVVGEGQAGVGEGVARES